jgi:hypothetical protein
VGGAVAVWAVWGFRPPTTGSERKRVGGVVAVVVILMVMLMIYRLILEKKNISIFCSLVLF